MKKLPSLLVACASILMLHPSHLMGADSAQVASGTMQTGPITTGLRVFTAGHSFHATFIPKLVSTIAASANIQGHTIAGVSTLGGSKAIQHFEANDPKHTAKAAVTEGNIDVLTLSCMTDPDEGIADFAKLGFEHNPNIRITLQELWLPQDRWPFDYHNKINQGPEDFNNTKIEDLKKYQAAYDKAMEDYVTGVNKSLGKQVVFIVPDGDAAIALREKILAGAAPGLTKQSDLFGDWWGHPKFPLQVLSGYCHFAVIYRRSPVGLPVPPEFRGVPADLIHLLQQIAWDTVTHHPLTGLTAADAR